MSPVSDDELINNPAIRDAAQMLWEGANQSVSGSAIDAAGNGASAALGGLNVDMTAPTLSGAPATAPNSNGWYNGDVTVVWACADDLSGIDVTCPADSIVMGESSNLSVGATVADRAGNTASATVDNLHIDRTAPTAQLTQSPNANNAGWNNSFDGFLTYFLPFLQHLTVRCRAISSV